MNWLDEIYLNLNKKYSVELAKYGMTAQEIVKLMWHHIRKHMTSAEMPDILVFGLGTFKVTLANLYVKIGRAHSYLDDPDYYENKTNKIKELVAVFNSKINRQFNKCMKHPIVINGDELSMDGRILEWRQTKKWKDTNARKKRFLSRLRGMEEPRP